MNKYDGLAHIIMENIGGRGNVDSVTHCVTRLRFKLKDEKKTRTDVLEQTDGIMKVIQSGGQYQIVIGPAVDAVYDAVIQVGKLGAHAEVAPASNNEGSLFDRFVHIVSGVFTPMVGVLCSCGVVKGVLSALVTLGFLSASDGVYVLLYNAANAFYYFLPIVIALNASKVFHMHEITALTIGMAMCAPALTSIASSFDAMGTVLGQDYQITFFGIPVVLPPNNSYAQSVIPAIAIVWLGSKIEAFLKRVIPAMVQTFLVPMLSIIVLVPMFFLIVGPVTSMLSNGVSALVTNAYNVAPWLENMLLAGMHQVLVIFGLHWCLSPIRYNNFANLGYCQVTAANFVAPFSQTGACAAVMVRTHDARTKALSASSVVSGIFGISEPAIYSINLPRKIPFICGCVGSSLAGLLCGIWQIKIYSAGMGLFALPNFIDPVTGDMTGMLLMGTCVLVSFVASFVLTLIFYKPQTAGSPNEATDVEPAVKGTELSDAYAVVSHA